VRLPVSARFVRPTAADSYPAVVPPGVQAPSHRTGPA